LKCQYNQGFSLHLGLGRQCAGAKRDAKAPFLLSRRRGFKPRFTGSNGALQHEARLLWRSKPSHLYVETAERGFGSRRGVHRPWKKSDFSAIFAFDLARTRTYNPRPRCFAADVAKRCSPLNLDAKNVGGRCLTL
jgi:hypothetical protein